MKVHSTNQPLTNPSIVHHHHHNNHQHQKQEINQLNRFRF